MRRPTIGWGALVGAALLAMAVPEQACLAWGPEGHRVIALIADDVLRKSDPAAHNKVLALLASDKDDRLTKNDIASEASWADVLREKSPEARAATALWRTVRFKAGSPDLATACFGRNPLPDGYPASHGPQNNCSVDKIEQFEAELRDPVTSPPERLAALQFLLNLVGDLHDPLLAIDHGDQGGECTAVQVNARAPVRLNAYWRDTLVREVAGSDAAAGATRIAGSVPGAVAQQWFAGNPETWARETYEVAVTVTYGFATGQQAGKYSFALPKGQHEACLSVDLYRVGPEYETKALAAVKTQLAKGGVRLARVLHDSFR